MKKEFNIKRIFGLKFVLLVWILFVLSLLPVQAGRLLHSERVEPYTIEVSKNGNTQISWYQIEDSKTNVFISDLKGNIVRTLYDKYESKAGQQSISWNGRDDSGDMCPNGVYIPLIRIKTEFKGDELYNPTMSDWGKNVSTKDLVYDAKNKKVYYNIDQPAFYRIVAGEKGGGPAYKILQSWKARSSGNYENSWDGMDESGLFNVMENEKCGIVFESYSLPENSIIIAGSKNTRYKSGKKWKKQSLRAKGVCADRFAQQSGPESLKNGLFLDVYVRGSKKKRKGIPILKGKVQLKVFSKRNLKINKILNLIPEVYLFVDGKLAFENPTNTLPVNVILDTGKYSNGEHIITLNFKTIDGYIEIVSKRINIKN